MTICAPDVLGQEPVNITWNVVRGDTASIRIDFLEEDETTAIDISGWEIVSSAYDPRTTFFDELDVSVYSGYIILTAPAEITENWGTGIRARVNELSFDVQVTLEDDTIWTAVRGFISVIGDVTGGSL
jgi:hypothetical protein